MKDLTNAEKYQLLDNVKSFLNITWHDSETEQTLLSYIISSINRIDMIAGAELDYLITDNHDYEDETYVQMCYMGKELLLNRVFYMNEKGLDDFETNYLGEVTSLYLLGKIYKDVQER